jgi:hypothetical protein
MLEAEVCHNDEEGLAQERHAVGRQKQIEDIKERWYGQRNTYRWKGLFNNEEITYTYNTETDEGDHHVGEIRGEIPDRDIFKDYLFMVCYRNGIGIPGNLLMVKDEITRAKMISVMNDYSYEEYYDPPLGEDPYLTPWPRVLGYNVNTFHPKTVAERKAIAECDLNKHIKITHGI